MRRIISWANFLLFLCLFCSCPKIFLPSHFYLDKEQSLPLAAMGEIKKREMTHTEKRIDCFLKDRTDQTREEGFWGFRYRGAGLFRMRYCYRWVCEEPKGQFTGHAGRLLASLRRPIDSARGPMLCCAGNCGAGSEELALDKPTQLWSAYEKPTL